MNSFSKGLGIAILAVALLHFGSAQGAPIVYGNAVDLGFESAAPAGYLVGFQITVSETVLLLDAGIVFRTFGDYNANVGLYSADLIDGLPDQLLATTGEFFVSSAGAVEVPFTSSPVLAAGDYWFAVAYSNLAYIGAADPEQEPSGSFAYRTVVDSSTLPTSFGPSTAYTGWDVNYFIVTEAVPEPAVTTLLIGSGAVALASVRRRTRQA